MLAPVALLIRPCTWYQLISLNFLSSGEPGNFPPPTTPDEVGARVLMQERMDNGEQEVEEEEMEEEYEREGRPDDDDMQIGKIPRSMNS